MKLRAIAASVVLAGGVMSAAPADAAQIVFDVDYTSATTCPFGPGACSADPNFQPFSRRLVFQLTSVQVQDYDPGFGPGGFAQIIPFVASVDPNAESPDLLAVGGLAAGAFPTGNSGAVFHDPADGYDETDFLVGVQYSTFSVTPNGYVYYGYGQSVQIPGYATYTAPSAPVDATGFLDFLVGLGPFEAREYGSVYSYLGGEIGGQQVYYDGTATLDRAASAIPEPAAWTLMIAGFGLAGAALRRRASLVVAG